MRKGPWTAEEDSMLIDYVNKYGEGNWNNVHKNSPLARCGKSCRLRWANHLRPNLKKAPFSLYEQSIIIHLHYKLGNKWARMASLLPGRTDNEIKNFWNTRMKRALKAAGSPVNPLPFQDAHPPYQRHYFTQPPSFSFPSSHSALHAHPFSNTLLSLPLSPYGSSSSSSSSSSSTLQNHGFAATDHSVDYGFINSSAVTLGSLYEPLPLVPGLSTEISSCQKPPPNASLAMDYYEAAPLGQPNSGLLEDLVVEARAFARHEKYSKNEDSNSIPGRESSSLGAEKSAVTKKNPKGDAAAAADTDERNVFRLFPLSTEKKPLEEDDDPFSLLNNYSSEMPMLEWYSGGGRQSLEFESQADTLPDSTDQEFAWAVGDCWSNIPRIC